MVQILKTRRGSPYHTHPYLIPHSFFPFYVCLLSYPLEVSLRRRKCAKSLKTEGKKGKEINLTVTADKSLLK